MRNTTTESTAWAKYAAAISTAKVEYSDTVRKAKAKAEAAQKSEAKTISAATAAYWATIKDAKRTYEDTSTHQAQE